MNGPEDLQDRFVRTEGMTWQSQAEALGMTAVHIPGSDEYEAMQRGVLDCSIATMFLLKTLGSWGVASYVVPGVFAANPGT